MSGSREARRPEVLWCGRNNKSRRDGWSFPPAVRELLIRECQGMSVLHLFGGKADFGIRLDVDPATQPHVVGDAWLPPFAKDSFDVVVMDPPYIGEYSNFSGHKINALFSAACWIARRYVVWFHVIWIENPVRLKLHKAWLVRVGRNCAVRGLQVFSVPDNKLPPVRYFKRGPAIKYNRWLNGTALLPLDAGPAIEL